MASGTRLGSQRLSQTRAKTLGGPLRSGRTWHVRRLKARSKRSETKCEPLCQFCVSWHTLSWSVPAEIAEMAETGIQTKTWIYADFIGLSREKDWCCQTGLNCRPLHYQWSALPLSYGSMPGSENRPKRPLQAGRSLPQGPRSRKRADGRRGSQNGQNQPGRP